MRKTIFYLLILCLVVFLSSCGESQEELEAKKKQEMMAKQQEELKKKEALKKQEELKKQQEELEKNKEFEGKVAFLDYDVGIIAEVTTDNFTLLDMEGNYFRRYIDIGELKVAKILADNKEEYLGKLKKGEIKLPTRPKPKKKVERKLTAFEKALNRKIWNDVQYAVRGTCGRARMTFANSDGGTSQKTVALPHVEGINANLGQFLYLSAQNKNNYGKITAQIYKKGVLFKTATSEGAYVIATVSGKY